jgi:hypothetical protein
MDWPGFLRTPVTCYKTLKPVAHPAMLNLLFSSF